MAKNEEAVKNGLFAVGDKNVAYQQFFQGQSYLNNLVVEITGTFIIMVTKFYW